MKRKSIRQISSLFLVLCLTAVLISSSVQAANFSDTSSHWAKEAVDRWSEYGILKGYEDGSFLPNGAITRAEMAVVLDRVFCYQTKDETIFADVENGTWYADSIYHLSAAGVMQGDGVNVYPQNNITREEAAVLIARAFELAESDASLSYNDADQISEWAIGYIRTMSANGYVQGDAIGAFNPKANLTRAEAVTMLDNIVTAFYPTSKTKYAGTWSGNSDEYTIVSAAEGITLKNMTIGKNLIITENVTGEVVLENVTVIGAVSNRSGTTITETTVASDGVFTYHGYNLSLFSNVRKNTLSSENFYQDDEGAIQYSGTEVQTLQGIDVSYAQGERGIDWTEVATSGIDFVMVQVGFRGWGSTGSLNIDSYFESNISGALEAGLPVGVYFFSQATTVEEAVEEAEFILPYLAQYDITYPVVFDWETIDNESSARTNGVDAQTVTNCADAFCQRIAEAGYTPMVYFNQAVGYLTYDLSVLADYGFWFAQYDTAPNFQYAFDIWQYTDSGSVPGVTGAVDRNIQFIYE